MSNLLRTASAWLAGQLKANVSESVTIERSGQQTAGVLATAGRTLFENDDGSNVIDRWQIADFLIDAADYVINAAVTLPQRGDKLIRTIGATTVTYEVDADRDKPAFEYLDDYRTKLRIHYQQVS